MFNKNIKLVVAGLIVGWAVYQFVEGNIGNGISLILLAGIFVFFYFKNEILLLAFLKMRKQDFAGSTKLLSYIKNPSAALIQKQEGYYNFLQGIMVSQTNITPLAVLLPDDVIPVSSVPIKLHSMTLKLVLASTTLLKKFLTFKPLITELSEPLSSLKPISTPSP